MNRVRPSIHSLVLVIVILPIIVVSAALMVISTFVSRGIEGTMSASLVRTTARQVRESLDDCLREAERANDLYERRLRTGALPATPNEAWTRRMQESLSIRPRLGSMTYATSTGQAVYVMRYNNQYVMGKSDGPGKDQTNEYILTDAGIPESTPLRTYTYSVAERPWYQRGLKADNPTWTDVYSWFSSDSSYYRTRVPGIGYVRRTKQDGVDGMLLVDVTLQSLRDQLRESEIARIGSLYIVDDENRVIAHSRDTENGNSLELPLVTDIGGPDAKAAHEALGNQSADPFSVHLGSLGRHVYVEPIVPSPLLNWRLVTVLPDSSITGEIWPMYRNAILVSGAVVFITLLAALWMTRWLTRPIAQLAAHVRQIGLGSFDQTIQVKSTIEFDQLSNAVNDMTAQLQAQVTLRAEKEAVERAAEAKGAFFSRVTHELRTPMNAILGYGEILEENKSVTGNPVIREDLRRLMQAGRQLLRIINELLDLARIESGGMTVEFRDIDIPVLMREIEDIARPVVQQNGNRLMVDVQCDAQFRSDNNKLRQILLNLVSNAAKFTHDGTVTVSVTNDNAYVRFSIADTGVGIPNDRIARMFEPFARGDSHVEGTGLGLTISRQLTLLLGGDIDLHSEPGRGTTVDVYFPVNSSAAMRRGGEVAVATGGVV